MNETPGRQKYGVHAKLEVPAAVLGGALARWGERDDTRPQPEIRAAAKAAMGAIDGMLRELYLLRGRLVSEIRASDDAAMARSGELLDRSRQPTRCGDHHASGVTSCTREAGHDGAHHNGSGLTW